MIYVSIDRMVKNAAVAERPRHLNSYLKYMNCYCIFKGYIDHALRFFLKADSETFSILEIKDSDIKVVLAFRLSKHEE